MDDKRIIVNGPCCYIVTLSELDLLSRLPGLSFIVFNPTPEFPSLRSLNEPLSTLFDVQLHKAVLSVIYALPF